MLAEADRDGYLGPQSIRPPLPNNRWPHVVFFRAMMGQYLATGDRRIPQALRRHYLADHRRMRWPATLCNVEIMLWTYTQTGDRRLLQQALRAYEGYNKWLTGLNPPQQGGGPRLPVRTRRLAACFSDSRPSEHGVTFCEIGKLGAILYAYTGKKRSLDACVNGFAKMDRYSMLIDGVPSSVEQLSGKDPLIAARDLRDRRLHLGHGLPADGYRRRPLRR